MLHFYRHTALAALLLASVPATEAAVLNFTVNGTLDSGFYTGATYSGYFSFDDAGLTNSGTEWLPVSNLSLDLLGTTYDETDADVGSVAEVGYQDGAFLGLSFSVSSADPQFSLIPGTVDSSDAYLGYDTTQGLSGAGSIGFTQVPEPETLSLMLAGLAVATFRTRRRVGA